MTFFSVVIPSYNREDLIVGTVKSVLNQSFKDFEVIIVDDGSTDNTSKIIESFFTKVNKLNYYYKENAERGAARNFGFQKAKGNYIVFFDSDDYMHQNHLSILHTYIKHKPDINFFATKYDFIKNKKNVNIPEFDTISEGLHPVDFLLKGNILSCNYCIKKENPKLHLFVELRAYAVMEDWMFLIQNLAHESIFIIDRITLSMIDHDHRSMKGNNLAIIGKRQIATEWIKNHVTLDVHQIKTLQAYSDYFCAIHYYIEGERRKVLSCLKKAAKIKGWTKEFLILYIKSLIGKKLINRLNNAK